MTEERQAARSPSPLDSQEVPQEPIDPRRRVAALCEYGGGPEGELLLAIYVLSTFTMQPASSARGGLVMAPCNITSGRRVGGIGAHRSEPRRRGGAGLQRLYLRPCTTTTT